MDANVAIKEEIDICDYEINPQEILNSKYQSLNDHKMIDVQSGEPFSIVEDRDMITVNVGSLQSEEERNFIANIDFEKIFTDVDVTNVCAFCQKSFNNVQSFLEHKKQSLCQFFWLQSYSCTLCSLVFEFQHKLDKHYRLHQRNMYFCQTGCGKFFRKLECCLEHEFRDHSGEERKFKCRICNKILPSSNQLMQHVGSIHAYVYRYVCSLCRLDFESAVELKDHWTMNVQTCGSIKFDEQSCTSGELVLVKSFEDNKRKQESKIIHSTSEIQVKTEDESWNINLPEIKEETMYDEEDKVRAVAPILNNLEYVKLEIKQELNYETENENDTAKYADYKSSNTLNLSRIQYSDTTLDISKLRLPSLRREQSEIGQETLSGPKKTPEDALLQSSYLKAPTKNKDQGTYNLPLQKSIKLGSISKTKASITATSSDNVKLKRLAKGGVPFIENSSNMKNSIKYVNVIPLQSNKKVSSSDCKTSVEINENITLTGTIDNNKFGENKNNNHLKPYNVLNLPSNAKIIPLHSLKVLPATEYKNSSQNISATNSTASVTSSIPKNIKVVKLSQCQRVSLEPNSQNSNQHIRRNFCLTNDTMSYIEALPESRKVIEDFKNKIRCIEQTSPLLGSEHKNNYAGSVEIKRSPEPQQKKEDNSKNSMPSSLYLSLGADSDKSLMHLRCAYPYYRYSWMCPKCPRQYELKYAFRSHLTSAHGMTHDEYKKLKVEVRPQQKEENDCLKSFEPSSLYLSLSAESDKSLMHVRWAYPDYRFSWICPKCPRQYELKYAFRTHLTSAHGMSQDEYKNFQFVIRPFKLISPMKAKTRLNETKVASTVEISNVAMHVEELDDNAITNSKDANDIKPPKSKGVKPRQYECTVCLKRFSASGTLNCHMSIHTGELPHKCNYCDKRFRTRGQVTVHHRTHTGERPFTCQVCSLGFTHRETLISHLSRHIGMKRYKCYGCDKTFSCISGLRTHRDVRPDSCGLVKFSPRAIGPRVRVVRGNVIFEQQPKDNPYLRSDEPPEVIDSQDNVKGA